jgi:hypothetical protein
MASALHFHPLQRVIVFACHFSVATRMWRAAQSWTHSKSRPQHGHMSPRLERSTHSLDLAQEIQALAARERLRL